MPLQFYRGDMIEKMGQGTIIFLFMPFHIANNVRAALHKSLSRGFDAGMAADMIVSSVCDIGDKQLQQRLLQASNAIRKGQLFTVALNQHGLLTNFDNALLTVGEQVGALGSMHDILSKRYETQYARRSKIKARMMMPISVAVIGLFVILLPALFAETITLGQYFLQSMSLLISLMTLWHIFRNVFQRYESQGWPGYIISPLIIIPLFRKWILTSARAVILENLAVLMEAGIPAQRALEICEKNAPNDFSRKLVTKARRSVTGGIQLAEALAKASLLDMRGGFAIVSTGEAAGKLTESLKYTALSCQVMMDRVWDQSSEWTPRVVYIVLAVFIAKGILF